jgi:hypothetical protein
MHNFHQILYVLTRNVESVTPKPVFFKCFLPCPMKSNFKPTFSLFSYRKPLALRREFSTNETSENKVFSMFFVLSTPNELV